MMDLVPEVRRAVPGPSGDLIDVFAPAAWSYASVAAAAAAVDCGPGETDSLEDLLCGHVKRLGPGKPAEDASAHTRVMEAVLGQRLWLERTGATADPGGLEAALAEAARRTGAIASRVAAMAGHRSMERAAAAIGHAVATSEGSQRHDPRDNPRLAEAVAAALRAGIPEGQIRQWVEDAALGIDPSVTPVPVPTETADSPLIAALDPELAQRPLLALARAGSVLTCRPALPSGLVAHLKLSAWIKDGVLDTAGLEQDMAAVAIVAGATALRFGLCDLAAAVLASGNRLSDAATLEVVSDLVGTVARLAKGHGAALCLTTGIDALAILDAETPGISLALAPVREVEMADGIWRFDLSPSIRAL
ncbi:MAG: hypothetical protein MUF14_05000, partial [Hyphomonadaceae bacterium]|nr:hypothetical protein [Hyphomonadaceae bacterium]